MRKNFTFTLPDEPYKNTTALNKTVNAVYTGPRYLAICVIDSTGEIKYVARSGETEEEIDMPTLVDDDPATEFYLIDAGDYPMAAAYLTHSYTTPDGVPDYSETLTDADGEEFTYEYHYDDDTGALGQCFYTNSLKYVNRSFVGPEYRLHANTRESTLANYEAYAVQIEQSLAVNDYPEDDARRLAAHAEWLKTIRAKYANIDHWKIPFHTDIPAII